MRSVWFFRSGTTEGTFHAKHNCHAGDGTFSWGALGAIRFSFPMRQMAKPDADLVAGNAVDWKTHAG